MSLFLTTDELKALTGTARPKIAMRWLKREGFVYMVGVDGWPRVLRTAVLARLGEKAPTPSEPRLHLA